jgi:hypothetical protein
MVCQRGFSSDRNRIQCRYRFVFSSIALSKLPRAQRTLLLPQSATPLRAATRLLINLAIGHDSKRVHYSIDPAPRANHLRAMSAPSSTPSIQNYVTEMPAYSTSTDLS